jgi:thiol-disulfide isomerase/thioredoxin
MEKKKKFNLITSFLIILLVIIVVLGGIFWLKSKNLEKKDDQNKNDKIMMTPTSQPNSEVSDIELFQTWFQRFVTTEDEVCQENGKPLFYYFGASTCSHCQWEYPIIKTVVKNFPDQIIFRDNMDKLNNLESQDLKVLNKYSSINKNGIPFLILGCKYGRVGSAQDVGTEKEEKFLTTLMCKLTNGQPEKVCSSVKDLVEQVK